MTTTTAEATTTVTLNPDYALPHTDGQLIVTRVPGGFWAVKIRQRGSQWIAFAVPRFTNPGDPFLIAVGDQRAHVAIAGMRWRDQAVTLACRLDRVIYVGAGNATHERLNTDDSDSRWPALDRKERQS